MRREIILGMVAFFGILSVAYGLSVSWDTNDDFSDGVFSGTKNVSGDLMLNDTLGVYEVSGYYISSVVGSYDPVESVVPTWSETEPNENVNVSVAVSVDGGENYCDAENGVEINDSSCPSSGYGSGQEIVFRADFRTNDTSLTALLHDITLDYEMNVPYLEVNMTAPLDNTIVGHDRLVAVNATVTCRVADCGLVNATVRYNGSLAVPDTPVSEDSGDSPFYVVSGINTVNCSDEYLTSGEECEVSWMMNATGELSVLYIIDVMFESNRSTVADNHTADSLLEIGKVIIINLDFTEIDFGVLDPGDSGEGTLNDVGYNISVDVNSNDVENMWIKGSNLTIDDDTGLDCSVQEQFNRYEGNTTNYPCQINVTRISWSMEKEPAADKIYPLSGGYERMNKDMQVFPSGTSFSTYYWIDVPFGVYAGGYTGNIMFLANATW